MNFFNAIFSHTQKAQIKLKTGQYPSPSAGMSRAAIQVERPVKGVLF